MTMCAVFSVWGLKHVSTGLHPSFYVNAEHLDIEMPPLSDSAARVPNIPHEPNTPSPSDNRRVVRVATEVPPESLKHSHFQYEP